MILDHARNVQIFHVNGVKVVHEIFGNVVVVIVPNACDFGIRFGDFSALVGSVSRALDLASQLALLAFENPLGFREHLFRVMELVAGTQDQEIFESQVKPDLFARCGQKVDIGFNQDADVVTPVWIFRYGGGFDSARKGAVEDAFDVFDFWEANDATLEIDLGASRAIRLAAIAILEPGNIDLFALAFAFDRIEEIRKGQREVFGCVLEGNAVDAFEPRGFAIALKVRDVFVDVEITQELFTLFVAPLVLSQIVVEDPSFSPKELRQQTLLSVAGVNSVLEGAKFLHFVYIIWINQGNVSIYMKANVKRSYNSRSSSKFLLKAHMIFVVKYRKSLLVGRMKREIMRILLESQTKNFKIEVMESDNDHLHMLINYVPQVALSNVARRLKQMTAYGIWQICDLRDEFWRERTFWTDGYFVCSVGDASEETVRRYIESQG